MSQIQDNNKPVQSTFFTLEPFTAKTSDGKKILTSTQEKILTIALSVLVGLLTFGIGGVFAFFGLAKALRERNIREMQKEETPLSRLNKPFVSQENNQVSNTQPPVITQSEIPHGEPDNISTVEPAEVQKREEAEQKLIPAFTSCALPIEYSDPCDNPEFVENLQKKLDSTEIALNIKGTPRQLNFPNRILRENIEQMLQEANKEGRLDKNPAVKAALEKFYNGIDLITFDELKRGLKACCDFLNQVLGNEKFALGFEAKSDAANKKYSWLSALALPHLNKMPENHFNFESKIGLSPHLDNFESLMPNVNNFVIFDDLDYSGHDSINLVQTIAPVLKNHPMTHFYLVIPFMSKKAKNGVLYYIQRYQLEKQIHLITTDRSIVSMQEHFSKEEVLNLIKFDSVHDIQMRDWHAEYFQSGASRVREEQIPDRALSVSEWYISEHEVPETLKYRRSPDYKEKCRFMTHFAPPYMDENQGLDRPFVASFDEF